MHVAEIKELTGILIVCDADAKTADVRREGMLRKVDGDFCFDQELLKTGQGDISGVSVDLKTGIYVLPNDQDSGTLEDILLESAEAIYPDILSQATTFVSEADSAYKERSSFGEKKAIVGCIASILRSGLANQVSIYKDEWIGTETIERSPLVKQVYDFITEFISE